MDKVDLGPFVFHLTERVTLRLMPLLPANPTFEDMRTALVRIVQEDAAKVQ